MNKLILLPTIGTFFSFLNADAAVIFDASPTNSRLRRPPAPPPG
ncbi:hypothetical protein N9192_01795 [Akkermansiaceae bacterium]|nr:hypothetical protein [Akkermansiaceae bacterium]MDB4541607.1 hypothetical protein [Akkermansiaceae bacterium]